MLVQADRSEETTVRWNVMMMRYSDVDEGDNQQ